MNEPTSSPPPPPVAGVQKKKGLGLVAWILIGCLGILLLGGLVIGACTFVLGKKVAEVAEDFEGNPAGTIARMAVKANPDLELVEEDPDEGTLTIRDKSTGKTLTVNYDDLAAGKISFETDEGSMSVDATAGPDGVVKIQSDDGETVYGTGGAAGDVPDWVPVYPGAGEPEMAFSSRGGGQETGAFGFSTSDSPSRVLRYFEEELAEAGFQVTVQTAPTGGLVIATGDGRSVQLTAAVEGEGTQVSVNFTHSVE